jgi:alanyl-tRNA synthetase
MTGADTKEKFWSGNDIRETFLRFFESKGHRRMAIPPCSSPTPG